MGTGYREFKLKFRPGELPHKIYQDKETDYKKDEEEEEEEEQGCSRHFKSQQPHSEGNSYPG